MKLKRPIKKKTVNVIDIDPKVRVIRDAVDKYRIAVDATEEFDKSKEALKKDVFPFGERSGDSSWRFSFGDDNQQYKGVSVLYTEQRSSHLDLEAAEKVLKAKRLYTSCLTVPLPAPPPKPFLDEEKIMQYFSEGKLTAAEVKKMIKTDKTPVKKIAITLPEKKKSRGKTKSK